MDDIKPELTNPHDRFFKNLMGRPGVIGDFITMVTAFPAKEGVVMSTLAEQWIREGKEEGRQEGRREAAAMASQFLQIRFGSFSDEVEACVSGLSLEQLGRLSQESSSFAKVKDLEDWLGLHG